MINVKFILVFFIFGFSSICAETTITPKLGLNLSTIKMGEKSGLLDVIDKEVIGYKIGYSVGVDALYLLPVHFKIGVGCDYSNIGYTTILYGKKSSYKLGYIHFIGILGYSINIGKIEIEPRIKPTFGILATKYQYVETSRFNGVATIDTSFTRVIGDKEFTNSDFGLDIGGCIILFKKVSLESGYYFGLTNIVHDFNDLLISDLKKDNRYLYVTVGYQIKL